MKIDIEFYYKTIYTVCISLYSYYMFGLIIQTVGFLIFHISNIKLLIF